MKNQCMHGIKKLAIQQSERGQYQGRIARARWLLFLSALSKRNPPAEAYFFFENIL